MTTLHKVILLGINQSVVSDNIGSLLDLHHIVTISWGRPMSSSWRLSGSSVNTSPHIERPSDSCPSSSNTCSRVASTRHRTNLRSPVLRPLCLQAPGHCEIITRTLNFYNIQSCILSIGICSEYSTDLHLLSDQITRLCCGRAWARWRCMRWCWYSWLASDQEMGRTADTITPAQCRLKVLIIGYFVS